MSLKLAFQPQFAYHVTDQTVERLISITKSAFNSEMKERQLIISQILLMLFSSYSSLIHVSSMPAAIIKNFHISLS